MTQQSKKRKDSDPTVVLLRYAAGFVAQLLAKTKITPNQITVLNFVIFTPLILYFFIKGTYLDNLIALFFIFVQMIFDLCDGLLARMKSLGSEFGAFLDSSLDGVLQGLIFISVIIGTIRITGDWQWLIPGLIVLFGQSMANCMGLRYEKEFDFDAYCGSQEFSQMFSPAKKISWLDFFLKNIIVPSKHIFILFFTCRYLLVLGIIFNRLDLFLIIFGITINIRWLSMYFMYLRYLYGTESKLFTIKFLKELSLMKKDKKI